MCKKILWIFKAKQKNVLCCHCKARASFQNMIWKIFTFVLSIFFTLYFIYPVDIKLNVQQILFQTLF